AGELRNKIAFKGAGSKVTLKIYRNGKYITVTATLKALKTKKEAVEDIETLKGVTLFQEKNSVKIADIDPDSYAARMGLQKGDEILRIKTIKTGKWVKVRSIEDVKKLLKDLDKGDALVEVKRKKELFIIQL
ncbi:PDZ domain-containing protein, partial [Caminibacter sp.]